MSEKRFSDLITTASETADDSEGVETPSAKRPAINALTLLKERSYIVADTGDFEAIEKYEARDATTNPSLLLKVYNDLKYAEILRSSKKTYLDRTNVKLSFYEALSVTVAIELLKKVKSGDGRISIEVDAKYSFNTIASVESAKRIVALVEELGGSKERILIKLATTWEMINACRILEKNYDIHCNMTLVFSLTQAIAAAQASATLISPFVGRILDWHKAKGFYEEESSDTPPAVDPGVAKVCEIYKVFKKYHLDKTTVMAASFRNKEEILQLCGCDALTISPVLLEELSSTSIPEDWKSSLEKMPHEENSSPSSVDKELSILQTLSIIDEIQFRSLLNEDAMATEKLAEGIRLFTKDAAKIEALANM